MFQLINDFSNFIFYKLIIGFDVVGEYICEFIMNNPYIYLPLILFFYFCFIFLGLKYRIIFLKIACLFTSLFSSYMMLLFYKYLCYIFEYVLSENANYGFLYILFGMFLPILVHILLWNKFK